MRRVIKELTGRVRSHRYFAAVRDVQRAGDSLSVDCPACVNRIGAECDWRKETGVAIGQAARAPRRVRGARHGSGGWAVR